MQRALDLAARGLGRVSPNPMVGCVIVHEGKIIGEGWHRQFGGPHAEVNAVNAVADKGLLAEATFYVTLEPCSYQGKTPACTDLLTKLKPQRVVVAANDPNPQVNGRGLAMLRQAGIEVTTGVLAAGAMALNKRFFVAMHRQRPYVVVKWAQTADGFIARKDYNAKWISNAQSRQLVHKWRTEEDAILVGFNTVKYDNPQLTARDWPGRNPVRVIIDPTLGIGTDFNVFSGDEKVLVFNTVADAQQGRVTRVKVSRENMPDEVLAYLYARDIGSVLIEGGAATLTMFINSGLWDEARVFTAATTFTEGIAAPELAVGPAAEQSIAGDRLRIMYNPVTKELWQKS